MIINPKDMENYNFNSVGDEIAEAFDEGYKHGVREFADFIISQMPIKRLYMGLIEYKQGIFNDNDINYLVEEFNNIKES